jgi:hypothetical protein
MAISEILVFGGSATNILSQVAYDGSIGRTGGHQSGKASSELENKALRQSSVMASGLAEFLKDNQPEDVVDTLTPAELADMMEASIDDRIPTVPDSTLSVKGIIQLATSAQAQLYGHNFLALSPVTMNQAQKGNNQSLTTDGFQLFAGGLCLNWNTVNVDGSSEVLVTFKQPFTTFLGAIVCPAMALPYGLEFSSQCCYHTPTSTNMYMRNSTQGFGDLTYFALGFV